jgi:hypothetical protein
MNTKLLFILLILSVVLTTSCKKDKAPQGSMTSAVLNDVSSKTPAVFSKIDEFMSEALSKAASSGYYIGQPSSSSKTSLSQVISIKKSGGDGWFGPDGDGWYIKTWKSLGYTYTDKIRCKDTTLTEILSIEYHGGDADYSNVYETQFTKYTKNKVVLWKGYADWKISTFGDNNISDVNWRFEFTDWNPQTGAGAYDWYWGAHSLGGDYVPYHRFLNIIATSNSMFQTNGNTLHVKITWYDGSVEVGSFEYDTTWEPVEMPDMPCGH